MTFDVGDKVVYPHHGAATIERREKKEAFEIIALAFGRVLDARAGLQRHLPLERSDGRVVGLDALRQRAAAG